MNKRTLQLAARIYSLAVIANLDQGGADTEDEDAMLEIAVSKARAKLAAMDIDYGEVATMEACLQVASQGS